MAKYSIKYNRGFSKDGYGAEFDLSAKQQESRLIKRLNAYDQWKKATKNERLGKLAQEDEFDKLGAVSSSWLTSLTWDSDLNAAVATFKDSSADFIYNISYKQFLDWLAAPSKGRWLHDHKGIMHNYTMKGGARQKKSNIARTMKAAPRKLNKTALKKAAKYR